DVALFGDDAREPDLKIADVRPRALEHVVKRVGGRRLGWRNARSGRTAQQDQQSGDSNHDSRRTIIVLPAASLVKLESPGKRPRPEPSIGTSGGGAPRALERAG